jgi:hypothetical protein
MPNTDARCSCTSNKGEVDFFNELIFVLSLCDQKSSFSRMLENVFGVKVWGIFRFLYHNQASPLLPVKLYVPVIVMVVELWMC